jgi:hypothetical protein
MPGAEFVVFAKGTDMDLRQPAIEETSSRHLTDTTEVQARRVSLAPWLAWSTWTASLLLLAIGLVLPYLTNPEAFAANLLVNALGTPALLAYATVGAIIAARRPENPIGWLFSATALLVAIGIAAEEYARYVLLAAPGSLPGGLSAAWLSGWVQNTGLFLMFTFLLLLFPDGRLPTRRWRITAWVVGLAVALVSLLDAFRQGPVAPTLEVDNPFGLYAVTELTQNVEELLILAAIIVCLSSVIVRFRRAKGDEYHQLKWFAYAAVVALAQFGARVVLPLFIPNPQFEPVYDALLLFSIATFPVAAGIAILKYRLYDIDLLVNRTLVYVPLTAILAGVYSASIALFQKFFVAATGEQSDAAIVITTLILVSSFTPIKNGLQSAVDKRFKEAPDPSKKLRAFSEQVRSFVQVNSADLLTQRLLDEATAAFNSTGGAIYAGQPGDLQLVRASDEWNGDARISVTPNVHSDQFELVALGARRNGSDYTPRDRQALQEIVDVVAQAIELKGRSNQ